MRAGEKQVARSNGGRGGERQSALNGRRRRGGPFGENDSLGGYGGEADRARPHPRRRGAEAGGLLLRGEPGGRARAAGACARGKLSPISLPRQNVAESRDDRTCVPSELQISGT